MAITSRTLKKEYMRHSQAVLKNDCNTWIVKLGETLRHSINLIIRKYSKVGNILAGLSVRCIRLMSLLSNALKSMKKWEVSHD